MTNYLAERIDAATKAIKAEHTCDILSTPIASKPVVAMIRRASGATITSAELGAIQRPSKMLASLDDVLTVALGVLELDGSVTIAIADTGAL